MKNAIVIGGTTGFGLAVTRELEAQGYRTVVLGRTAPVWRCDVGDLRGFMAVIEQMIATDPLIARHGFTKVYCVAGFARFVAPADRTPGYRREVMAKNYIYVRLAYRLLRRHMVESSESEFVTIGSRWSYQSGNPYFVDYIDAKHRLRRWVEAEACRESRGPRIKNYCVPTMITPQFDEVSASAALYEQEVTDRVLANPIAVARVVRLDLPSGVYVVDDQGGATPLPKQP